MAFTCVAVLECDIRKSDGARDFLGDLDFFADAVDEMEFALGPYYRERNAGEPATTSEVENLSPFCRRDEPGYGEAVEDMVRVEVVYVFAGNYIDFLIPFGVELA